MISTRRGPIARLNGRPGAARAAPGARPALKAPRPGHVHSAPTPVVLSAIRTAHPLDSAAPGPRVPYIARGEPTRPGLARVAVRRLQLPSRPAAPAAPSLSVSEHAS